MPRRRFPGVGTWKLASGKVEADDGSSRISYEAGLIIYDTKGNVSAQLSYLDRPKFVINDWLKGTPEEVKAAFEGFNAYWGTYDFDLNKKTVIHHITGASFPNNVGTDLVRHFEFNGNRMTLRTVPVRSGGKTVVGTYVWEKIA